LSVNLVCSLVEESIRRLKGINQFFRYHVHALKGVVEKNKIVA